MTNVHTRPLHRFVVLHLSGKVERALGHWDFSLPQDIQPLHDFIVAQPKRIIPMLRKLRRSPIVVVTKDLHYQRFRTIWKCYAAISGCKHFLFLDEEGKADPFHWGKFVAVELPLLMLELAWSAIILGIGWFRLRRYRSVCP
ncbi:MAG: hypothetical protein RMK00_00515 [Bacteroidota bacterium]|nr:hypothetical protein [Candidatus Kapabacteria bacterium]MDW8074246.1 hypothetical protein [Bacteroidota bacterium]